MPPSTGWGGEGDVAVAHMHVRQTTGTTKYKQTNQQTREARNENRETGSDVIAPASGDTRQTRAAKCQSSCNTKCSSPACEPRIAATRTFPATADLVHGSAIRDKQTRKVSPNRQADESTTQTFPPSKLASQTRSAHTRLRIGIPCRTLIHLVKQLKGGRRVHALDGRIHAQQIGPRGVLVVFA